MSRSVGRPCDDVIHPVTWLTSLHLSIKEVLWGGAIAVEPSFFHYSQLSQYESYTQLILMTGRMSDSCVDNAYGSHQDFLDKGLLLAWKLLKQRFLLVKMKSSLRKFDLVNRYWMSCHIWPRICSICCKHFPVLSSFMTYPRCYN